MPYTTAGSPRSYSFPRTRIAAEEPAEIQSASAITLVNQSVETILVKGAFPNDKDSWRSGNFAETIRDPKRPDRLAFLRLSDNTPEILSEIEQDGNRYTPPLKCSELLAKITLPNGILLPGKSDQLAANLESIIARFIAMDPADRAILVAYVLSSWLPECFDTVPYLWLLGPLGSGKTTVLKLLGCLCRRALLVGDIRPASLYQLVHNSDITLLLDELELKERPSASEITR